MARERRKDVNSSIGNVDKETYVGRTPEFELLTTPKWIVFDGSDGYRRPQIATVKLTNRDKEPIMFRLRGRDRAVMIFSKGYGIIPPQSSADITVIIPSSEQWHRDPNDFSGRRIRVVAENLLLPLGFPLPLPTVQSKITALGKKLFHTTASNAPLTRLYVKFNILLSRVPDDWALIELKTTTSAEPTPPTSTIPNV
uniref:MSP domain-containing protein n=1 Tax=Panagrolaimus sp. PS1159 TaxID=55785 RepID=A0AC35G1C8_9BILA